MLTDEIITTGWADPAAGRHIDIVPLTVARLRLRRLGAYTGAGIVSGVANVALFHLAVHARLAPHIAWVLAFEVGALLAFLLHRHVTWRDRRVKSALDLIRQLWRAQCGSVAALVLNLVIFTMLMRVGLPGDLDDAAGLAAGFALNLLLAHHYVYGPVRHREGWHRPRRS